MFEKINQKELEEGYKMFGIKPAGYLDGHPYWCTY